MRAFQPLIGPKDKRVLLLSNFKRPVAAEPPKVALFTGNYAEQVTWRDAATGRIIAESDFFEPLTPGSRVTSGVGGRVYRSGRSATGGDARRRRAHDMTRVRHGRDGHKSVRFVARSSMTMGPMLGRW